MINHTRRAIISPDLGLKISLELVLSLHQIPSEAGLDFRALFFLVLASELLQFGSAVPDMFVFKGLCTLLILHCILLNLSILFLVPPATYCKVTSIFFHIGHLFDDLSLLAFEGQLETIGLARFQLI